MERRPKSRSGINVDPIALVEINSFSTFTGCAHDGLVQELIIDRTSMAAFRSMASLRSHRHGRQ
jgi:hypothetical protein